MGKSLLISLIIIVFFAEESIMGDGIIFKSDLIKKMWQLRLEDKEFDGKGIFWDGEVLVIKTDSMDDETIVGDRFGVYNTDEIINDYWSVRVKTKDNIDIFEQDKEQLYYSGKDWKMEVKRIDYNERYQCYSEDADSLDISEDALPVSLSERYQESSLFLNFTECNNSTLVGYVYLFKDYYGNEYEVSYHGMGFVEDVFLNASCLGGSFNIVFDVDAWAMENRPSEEQAF